MNKIVVAIKTPFLIVRIGLCLCNYYFEKTFRKKRYANKQAHRVMLELANMLGLLKFDVHNFQEQLDDILRSKHNTQKALDMCLVTLREKYGCSDLESALDKLFDSEGVFTFEFEELICRIKGLTQRKHELERDTPSEEQELSANLDNAQRLREMVEWALVNLSDRIRNNRIKCTQDIHHLFINTEAEEILSYNIFSIAQCGIDAYV